MTVTLVVAPASSVFAYAVEEAPPAGWAVSNVTQAGAFDAASGKVKWGPFFDVSSRTLTYVVTPSAGATGMVQFAGVASFDGADAVITGQRQTVLNTTTSTGNAGGTSGTAGASRRILVGDVNANAGTAVLLPIQLVGTGIENTLSFSLQFDPAIATFTSLTVSPALAGTQSIVNTNAAASGSVGWVLALAPGQTFGAGTNLLATAQFQIAASALGGTTPILLGDKPVFREIVSAEADTLSAEFVSGHIVIAPRNLPKPVPFLLWQHDQGTIATWTMDGAKRTAAALLTPSDPGHVNWRVAGAGDFDQDGQSDLLWRHKDGTLAVWFMKDGTMQRAALVDANPGPDWGVGGSADFDGDGYADILLVHRNGDLGVWFMRAEKRFSAAFLSPSNANDSKWQVMGAADFGGDGRPDILWQHDNGMLAVWHMDSLTLRKAELLERDVVADPLWRIAALTDLDTNGTPDLVFQRVDGYMAAWFMSGLKVINATMLDPLHPDPAKKDVSWRVVGP